MSSARLLRDIVAGVLADIPNFVVLTMRQSGGGTLPPADGIGGSRHVDLMNTTLLGQGHRDRCNHFFGATEKDNRNQFLWPACWTEAS